MPEASILQRFRNGITGGLGASGGVGHEPLESDG
jgi:hypothetical protein